MLVVSSPIIPLLFVVMLLLSRSASFRAPASLGLSSVKRAFSSKQRSMSMKLQTGIVGLPNVGKSTLFNALVGSELAQAANFPFCTIEPNVGEQPAILNDEKYAYR